MTYNCETQEVVTAPLTVTETGPLNQNPSTSTESGPIYEIIQQKSYPNLPVLYLADGAIISLIFLNWVSQTLLAKLLLKSIGSELGQCRVLLKISPNIYICFITILSFPLAVLSKEMPNDSVAVFVFLYLVLCILTEYLYFACFQSNYGQFNMQRG